MTVGACAKCVRGTDGSCGRTVSFGIGAENRLFGYSNAVSPDAGDLGGGSGGGPKIGDSDDASGTCHRPEFGRGENIVGPA